MRQLSDKSRVRLCRENIRSAKASVGEISKSMLAGLRALSIEFRLSIKLGELLLLNGSWYVTHAGLMRLARRNHCSGIQVQPIRQFCDAKSNHWTFRAVVFKSRSCRGFVGYGDADPSNVSPVVRGSEMRIAETRAVNRALRKAYGIGTCSVEELGAVAPAKPAPKLVIANPNLGSSNGHSPHPLRDQLNALIHQHRLDPNLVKRYAAEFCGTQVLRDASKELIEDFITTLSTKAAEDLAGLKCQLNSYQTVEVRS